MVHQVLDTPMRMLVRKYPDLAEIVLDQCYKEKKNLGEGIFVDMTFEFIEDSFNYRYWLMWTPKRDKLICLQTPQRRPSAILVSRQFRGIFIFDRLEIQLSFVLNLK